MQKWILLLLALVMSNQTAYGSKNGNKEPILEQSDEEQRIIFNFLYAFFVKGYSEEGSFAEFSQQCPENPLNKETFKGEIIALLDSGDSSFLLENVPMEYLIYSCGIALKMGEKTRIIYCQEQDQILGEFVLSGEEKVKAVVGVFALKIAALFIRIIANRTNDHQKIEADAVLDDLARFGVRILSTILSMNI